VGEISEKRVEKYKEQKTLKKWLEQSYERKKIEKFQAHKQRKNEKMALRDPPSCLSPPLYASEQSLTESLE
jgi:hypothetical protein